MNRGAGRRPIFKTPAQRAAFLDLLDQISQIFGIEIHAYCLMDNHYHLLICTPEAGLGKAMRHLNGVYTQRFNRLVGTDGPLFRGRYKAILVDADSYLLRVNRYIHLNPVVEGLVSSPAAYPYSSYRAYLGLEATPVWLRTETCLHLFGEAEARQPYRQFVENGLDDEIRDFYSKQRLDPILGR
jgi:putative transposase